MNMRISFREGTLLSFVFALVFSSAYSEDPDRGEPCDGALLSVGKLVCDENALCYQNDGAFTCVCKDTYSGDGWAAGAGCIEDASQDKPESEGVESPDRQTRYARPIGMWAFSRSAAEPCKGFWAVMFAMVCVRDAVCMQGFTHGTWLKCVCQKGSGNGISLNFPSGTGCR